MTDLQHVANMKVAQAKIHLGDVSWYVTTANNYIVRGPFLGREVAEANLLQIRQWAAEEAAEELEPRLMKAIDETDPLD